MTWLALNHACSSGFVRGDARRGAQQRLWLDLAKTSIMHDLDRGHLNPAAAQLLMQEWEAAEIIDTRTHRR